MMISVEISMFIDFDSWFFDPIDPGECVRTLKRRNPAVRYVP